METFSFSIPQHVIFGKGSLGKLPEAAKALGKNKALIISGPHLNRIGMVDKCRAALSAAGIGSAAFTETEGNPSTETVEKAVDAYKSSGADFIVAFGGGSPLDVAKAASILVTYGGKITEYEGGGKVPGPVVPMIAIPTTAGTGSEVTSFSVITDHSRNYKLSVSSNYLLPAYAILDPELIASVPAGTAAACGVDAMVHALEAYLSLAASPFSDMFALKALQLIGKNLRAYAANRGNEAAAEAMMMGSLFAGIAFSHARLGDVHAMSHPVSAYFNVAHGSRQCDPAAGYCGVQRTGGSGKILRHLPLCGKSAGAGSHVFFPYAHGRAPGAEHGTGHSVLPEGGGRESGIF